MLGLYLFWERWRVQAIAFYWGFVLGFGLVLAALLLDAVEVCPEVMVP